MKTFTQEQILAAFNSAPPAIRDVYISEESANFVESLRDKYGLHVDVAGGLGRTIGFMLLGLLSPQEFLENITSSRVSESQARQIMADVNQKIFAPLQQQMREGGNKPTGQVGVPSYQAPKPPAPQPRPMQAPPPPRPPMPPQQRPMQQPYIPPPRPPVQQPSQLPSMSPQRPPMPKVQPQAPRVAPPPPPNLPGVMSDDRLLPDHEVGHINVPGTPSPPSQSFNNPPPPSPAPKPTAAYGIDPYREPFDES